MAARFFTPNPLPLGRAGGLGLGVVGFVSLSSFSFSEPEVLLTCFTCEESFVSFGEESQLRCFFLSSEVL